MTFFTTNDLFRIVVGVIVYRFAISGTYMYELDISNFKCCVRIKHLNI